MREKADNDPFEWIFGYGSLMWRPGFRFAEQRQARLSGFSRRVCVYSKYHRGTPERPGLVLGLDRGGECAGIAFRIFPHDRERIVAYLNEREMIGYPYRPAIVDIDLGTATASAYTFVADPAHEQYAGDLGLERTAEVIMAAEGVSGLNRDYLINTVAKLECEGFSEPDLFRLRERIKVLTGEIDRGHGI